MDSSRRRFIRHSAALGATLGTFGASRISGAEEPRAPAVLNEHAKALMSLFGLKYPILQAPTGGAASPALASAVSNAGALGAMALAGATPEVARDRVAAVRAATERPFVVNYVLRREPRSLTQALEAGAPIVQFSWGMPTKAMVSAVRTVGARFGIQVTSASSAQAALELEADYLVCQGTEAGGHVQATMTLRKALAQVLEVAKGRPVVASGGIADGRGIRRVLAAGASGAVLGTRFVATKESLAHPEYKRALVQATADDTALTVCFNGGWPNAIHRVLRNNTFTMWDAAGCPPSGKRPGERDVVASTEDGREFRRYSVHSPRLSDQGNVTDLALYAGQGVDRVEDIPTAGELVERLWKECETG